MTSFRSFILSMFMALCAKPALSKSVSDAVQDMGNTSELDPNGVKLMLVCIGLLVLVAGTLITVTVIYYQRSRQKNQK